MANLKETAFWEEGIYQFETTDPVLGGENGIDNKPTRQLANRTVWLKQEFEAAQQAQRNRQIIAGAGLTGGGNLSADRSIALATPSTLSGNTSNWAGNETVGHTHELAAATATLAGVVKLINTLDSTATDAALTAAQGKALNDALTALNNNAVTKTGDTMSGSLYIRDHQAGKHGHGLSVINTGGTANTACHVDFHVSPNANIPTASVHAINKGNGATGISLMTTTNGDTNQDRRYEHTRFEHDGQIWSRNYGWLHENFCPSGMVMIFAGDFASAGWLKANGAAVSRTVYAKLFAAIGTRYGAGDGHSTFNLPDLRGEFLRFWDDGRGVDAGRVLGSWQGDAIRNIAGNAATYIQDAIQPNGVLSVSNKAKRGIVWEDNWQNFGVQAQLDFDASRVVPTANENRPRNIALLACIKI